MATSAFSTAPRAQEMAQMNITPLVDVMLVLLVIFMIAAPVATGTLEMRLPQARRALPAPPPTKVLLQVHADGSYQLEGRPLSRAGLREALRDIGRHAPDTVVSIKADPAADYQAFTQALSAARQGGIQQLALAD